MYPDVVTDRKNSDVEEPLTEAQAVVLDKLLNPAGTLFRVGGRIAKIEQELSNLPPIEGKSGNTIIVTKTSGGAYTSLQAAVDAANAGDVVVVGAGSWGEVSLKPGVSLMGLQPPLADEVVLSKLTFAPGGGTAGTNTVFVSNLRVSRSDDQTAGVLGDGAPVRIYLSGVRFYRNNAAATNPLVSCYGMDASSSIYMQDCSFTHEGGQVSPAIILVSSNVRYLDLNNCTFSQGGHCLAVVNGDVAASLCRFETASTVAAIHISASAGTARLAMGNSLVRNLGADSTGILIDAGSVCAASDTVFDVSAGTGKCIGGTGILAKNNLTVQPAALGARNTSIAGPTALAFQTL